MQILIVDDDANARRIVAGMLTQLGHSVQTVASAEEAICCYRRRGADVILSDCRMPGMDGLELCRRLRKTPSETTPYPYIVLLTGLGAPEDVLRGMEAGADDYLIKPVDMRNLQARLIAAERVTRLHRQLFEASRTDPATGLFNRLALNERLLTVREELEASATGMTIALCDVDHFKRFNDRYGHLEGDLALFRVAEHLRNGIAGQGVAYRYGGEEFCLLIEALPPPATELLENLRRSVEAEAIPHEGSDFGVITLSLGVATIRPGDSKSPEQALSEADSALYQAKAFGRNRIAPRAFERLATR